MIAVLDYKAGNLTSMALAIRHLGFEPTITRDPDVVRRADRLVFPGVGAAGASMESLDELELSSALREFRASGRPMFCVCIGCQVLFTHSDEDGGTPCLDLLPGRVVRFEFGAGLRRKIPHMGWNEVRFTRAHPVFAGTPEGSQFYFVHSYHVRPEHAGDVVGTSVYGDVEFVAVVARENIAAAQFHPEKSGRCGLRVLDNFLRWTP